MTVLSLQQEVIANKVNNIRDYKLGRKFKISHIQEYPPSVRRPKIIEKKRKMFVFCCNCGTEILLVPDVSAMNKAIKNHLVQHEKLTGKYLTDEKLTEEILKVISKG